MNFNKSFWEQRFINNDTPWDIGYPSTPIVEYLDQIKNKELKILIPGAGNGYEAEYAYKLGFKNTFVLDIAENAIKNFKDRVKGFPAGNCILRDFFEHNAKYDLIIEQTFFCALEPSLRQKYATKMNELLSEKGHLIGVLFDDQLNPDRPPFGGNKEEYKNLFLEYFNIRKLEPCYNSIKPRKNRELFIDFTTKS